MSKDIKMGHAYGSGRGQELGVAANQYMHSRGGHFVYLDSAGAVTMCASNSTEIFGWACAPKNADGYNSWKSSSTAKADSVYVVSGLEDRFVMPLATSSASANATIVGKGCMTVETGSTYDKIQQAYYYSTAASNLLDVYDYDSTNQTVLVGIRPTKKQDI